jgi:dihydroorotate dehydrogenase/NAD-dependent dihydropyrimidine dehydrogenase PreA subunit
MAVETIDISVDLCGIHLKNPLIIAAGPYGRSGKAIKNIVIPRADPVGAIETKLVTCRWMPPMVRYIGPSKAWSITNLEPPTGTKYPTEGFSAIGMAYGMKTSTEEWLDGEFTTAVQAGKEVDIPIIVNGPAPMLFPAILDMFNTNAEKEIELMAEFAADFEQRGAAAVQALFHLASSPGYAWQNWSFMPKIMSALKKAVKIPVIAKALYHPSFVDQVAKPLEDAGADAIICTGFVRSTDIDIEHTRPSFTAQTGDVEITGAHQKPVALTLTAEAAKSGIKVPLIGGGGVTSARDVISYVMLGASCVQMVTAAMFKGLSIFKRIDRDIKNWLDAHGYKSLDDIRGIALEKWGDLELKALEKISIEIDESRCTGCGICERYCYETSTGAITVDDIARIDKDKCQRCSFCALLCPEQAIQVKGWPA